MIIHGREIAFRRTIGATCEVAKFSPNGDINKFDKLLLSKEYAVTQEAAAHFIVALNRGYEEWRKFEEPGYKPNPLTFDELMTVDDETFNTLFTDALGVWTGDGEITVEAETPKTKGKNAAGGGE